MKNLTPVTTTMSVIGSAHALVVGIANYQKIKGLPETVLKDAKDIYELLINPQHCSYLPDNVQLLLDTEATQTALLQALAKLAERSNQNSTVFIYISSHGGQLKSGSYAGEYLLPVDTDFTSEALLAQTTISGTQFTEALRAIPAQKLVVIFDCCHSGGIGQPKDTDATEIKTGLPESYYDTLKQGRGRVILASSRSTEQSYILPGAGNSLFTQHLLDGLKGEVIAPGGVIRILDLFSYLQPKVTKDWPQQHPILKAEIEENFPVALYMGGKAATPLPTTSPNDAYEYDVFISYLAKDADKTWVRKTLLPSLESKGLRVAIDSRFPLGVPLIISMERAIQQSRYTLVILSLSYLESSYGEFENLAAQHLGLEESKYRLIPIVREECTPRLGLRILFLLDMTDEDEFDTNMERLVYQLRQLPAGRNG
ncbi:caspase family protein [Scytonema sp. NUACC26]|uniref:caspase family protein n=1 Tax=Scytonema sp. NUACC26 TaxID=3140176 RepID=UPI0034DC9DE2